MNKNLKKAIISGLVGITVLGGLGFGFLCLERVPAGYVAVQYSMKDGVLDETLSQGVHFVSPFIKTSRYSIATEQLYMSADKREGSKDNDSFDVVTKDGKLNVDFEMSYNFDAERMPELCEKYRGQSGEDIVNTVIRGKIKTIVNEVTSKYTVLEVYQEKKSEINKEIQKDLSKELNKYGLLVQSANLTTVRPDEEVAKAIKERSKVAQELEKAKLDKEKAEIESERLKIEEQGKADAKVIKAQGEAKANEELQQSITPELLELKKIEAWNGQNSQIVTGSGSGLNVHVGN